MTTAREEQLLVSRLRNWLVLVLMILAWPSTSSALAVRANITVTSTSHETAPFIVNSNCTLGEAITAANTDTAIDGCVAGSGADVIELANGATYILAAIDNITDGSNGLPSISSEITINGNGATIMRAGSVADFRLLHVAFIGDLTLNNLTLNNGQINDKGGAIFNSGTTTMVESALNGNTSTGDGGALYNDGGTLTLTQSSVNASVTVGSGTILNDNGTFTLNQSTVSGNVVSGGPGGGLYNDGGTITVSQSTVSGNSAVDGGGVYNRQGGLVEIVNSTLSDNMATFGTGGGVFNFAGTVSLTNTTVTANTATQSGGGVSNGFGAITLANTIVADNPTGGDCAAPVTSNDYNLDSDGSCGLSMPNDLPTTAPLLSTLGNHGGPTETHALLVGSPAIDAGSNGVCATASVNNFDQRNLGRPVDGDEDGSSDCDIGAFEVQFTTFLPFVSKN